MASFSRGFGHSMFMSMPRSVTRAIYQPPPPPSLLRSRIVQAARAFQTSSCVRAKIAPKTAAAATSKPLPSRVPPAAKPPPPKPIRSSYPPASAYPPIHKQTTPSPDKLATSTPPQYLGTLAYIDALAAKGPTTLFTSPSHFWMRVSSLGAAAFCITYALVNYWGVILHPPDDIAWWVPHGFALICTFMVFMGMWFSMATAKIVRTIRVVPVRSLPGFVDAAARARGRNGPVVYASLGKSPIALEVTLSRAVPFLPPRKIYAAPDEIILPFQMRVTPLAQRGTAEEKVEAGWNPFRVFVEMFRGIKRGLTREGFSNIKVKGVDYRIDVVSPGGFLLENGRVMDRLVVAKPELMT